MESTILDIEQVDDVTVARLAGVQFDTTDSVDELRDELESLIAEHRPRKLLVSFCRVPHVTSQAIGALLQIRKNFNDTGGMMKLCEMHPAIRDAFTVLDLDGTLFPIHDCETEALNDVWTKPR